ncbi:MAG: hypothetical protein DKM50_07765 [Candidatus Margulisiibacteriota bacterium]|nr:MAG: hypothetical protein DKM50_07765 [Candidatus Margulisiibacteriota bacterium]
MITLEYTYICRKFHTYLNKLKIKLDKENSQYKSIEEKKRYLDSIAPKIYNDIDSYLSKMWDIAQPHILNNQEAYQKYKQFTRDLLLDQLFNIGPLNKRIHDKPLGYDGDYLVVHYFYLNDYLGGNLFEMLINRYTSSIPASQAHINRESYFNEYLNNMSSDEPLCILSLGCGPAKEIIELLKEKHIKAKIYLNDMESEAIEFVKNQLDQYLNPDISITYLHMNILSLVKNLKRLNLPKFDLIYSFGLFDYLNDKIAKLVINSMYNYLNNDGIFLITNVEKNIPNKINIEFLCDWKLIYRGQEQLIGLSDGAGYSKKHTFFDEKTKANIYLHLQK